MDLRNKVMKYQQRTLSLIRTIDSVGIVEKVVERFGFLKKAKGIEEYIGNREIKIDFPKYNEHSIIALDYKNELETLLSNPKK